VIALDQNFICFSAATMIFNIYSTLPIVAEPYLKDFIGNGCTVVAVGVYCSANLLSNATV